MIPSDNAEFQALVAHWMLACFPVAVCLDKKERNHRFYEESTELVQALGMSRDDAHLLVEYVYNRPIGQPGQEVGGVQITLNALCQTNGIDCAMEGWKELARIRDPDMMEKIRNKQAAKPKGSALPQDVHPDDQAVDRFAAALKARLKEKRDNGYSGWDNPDECSLELLLGRLKSTPVEKVIDIGNYAMMIWNRTEREGIA